jgi:hypothetical protein
VTSEPRPWSDEERAAGERASDAWQRFFRGRGADGAERAQEVQDTARVAEAQARHELALLARENVVGVAASLKMAGGVPTTDWSLTVFVERKVPESELAPTDVVPDSLDGVPTDVVEVGPIVAEMFNARVRPALPGFSIGHHNITAGTFGCLVRDLRDGDGQGDHLILSNNHVLANTNAAALGDLILQPGPFDGGVFPADGVATLDRFEPIVFGAAGYNVVDAAVARPTFSRNVTAAIIGVVIPRGVGQALVGARVIKAGRTTQVTSGNVIATNATVAVNYGLPGVATFRHQIITTVMSAGGDSGSLLMDSDLNAIGLLYAGSPVITIHNHIADVETALRVRPVTAS